MDTKAPTNQKVAVVTGASSGIGRHTAIALSRRGYHVHVVARRRDRLTELAQRIDASVHSFDIADREAIDRFAADLDTVDVLVHCAGGARGATTVLDANVEQWRWMWETNVLGTLQMTQALVPKMFSATSPIVVTVTSVAAFEPLNNSSGYSSSKHAQSVIHQTLRGELLGTSVRLTEVCPGIVDTEFFAQRFPDDPDRANAMFEGITALDPADVASVIDYAIAQPPHVNLDRIVVRPLAQAGHGRFHRASIAATPASA